MSKIDRFAEMFEKAVGSGLELVTNSLAGGILDGIFGIGGDGRYGSSAENFHGSGEALKPVIHLHDIRAEQVNVIGGKANAAEQATAPAQESTAEQAPQQSAEDWFHATREAAHADFVRRAAEQQAAQDVAENREQSLYQLAADPVRHYTQEGAFHAMLKQQQEREQEQQQGMGR